MAVQTQPGQQPYGQQPYMHGQPAVVQPGQAPAMQMQWMPMPMGGVESGFKGQVPPGLERLNAIDGIAVHQQIDWIEVISNWEVANRYNLVNRQNQHVLYCQEESDMCERQCCKNARGFILHLTDETGQEVMRVSREFRCCIGCCWCASSQACAFEVRIEAPVGQVVGYARQAGSCWKPCYILLDENYQEQYKIEGPCCVCQGPCCPGDVDWDIQPAGGSETKVGRIAKTYAGWADVLTNKDHFFIDFASDMDYKRKAVALGCTFLLHYMWFERNGNQ